MIGAKTNRVAILPEFLSAELTDLACSPQPPWLAPLTSAPRHKRCSQILRTSPSEWPAFARSGTAGQGSPAIAFSNSHRRERITVAKFIAPGLFNSPADTKKKAPGVQRRSLLQGAS